MARERGRDVESAVPPGRFGAFLRCERVFMERMRSLNKFADRATKYFRAPICRPDCCACRHQVDITKVIGFLTFVSEFFTLKHVGMYASKDRSSVSETDLACHLSARTTQIV